MKYYIIAGEASGDLHASNLMREINRLDAQPEYRCWGGDLMAAQGGKIVKHYKDLAFMGFWEVATHLRTILRNVSFCKKDILAFNPDLVIFVDYPGFNLRIADFVKKHGYKIVYYISPQIWAWKTGRVHKIKRTCDHVMPILPFEKEFYARYGYSVDFVGHPLLDAIDENIRESEAVVNFRKINGLDDRPIIALLPGSRKQEIVRILPSVNDNNLISKLLQRGLQRPALQHPAVVELRMESEYADFHRVLIGHCKTVLTIFCLHLSIERALAVVKSLKSILPLCICIDYRVLRRFVLIMTH